MVLDKFLLEAGLGDGRSTLEGSKPYPAPYIQLLSNKSDASLSITENWTNSNSVLT